MKNNFDKYIDLRRIVDKNWLRRYQEFLPDAEKIWADLSREDTQFGVERSTIRAISTGVKGDGTPLKVYNAWASIEFKNITNKNGALGQLADSADFDNWHSKLVTNLVKNWNSVSIRTCQLSVPHRYKLVDLLVRWMRVHLNEHPKLADACKIYGHIPLDRKSIHVLSETFGGIGLSGPFSMGDVHTIGAYNFYQQLARFICTEVGGSPLLFDVFCLNHPDAKLLYAKKLRS